MNGLPDMSLRDVSFHTLRKGILHGYLKPGERLMEIQLANRLGVSRTPVREAIRMLELEGLVINMPHRGAQVASITEKDLQDVLEVRTGLEEMAVMLACRRITDAGLEELYRASRDFERCAENFGDIIELAEADEVFHAVVYRSAENRRLEQLINNLRDQMFRFRLEYLKDDDIRQTLIGEHDELWGCLKRHDEEKSKICISQHIEKQMVAIREKITDRTELT